MEMKKVSILIPTYNRKELVCRTIDSALAQSYNNYEIIVVDNDSTDGSYEYLKNRYTDSKVRVYKNENNIGIVNNWRKALFYAEGDYIKILFSDDMIEANCLERMVTALESDSTNSFAISSVKLIDINDIIKRKMYTCGESGNYDIDVFLDGIFRPGERFDSPVSPGCALFRREAMRIDEKIPNPYGAEFEKTGAGIDLFIYFHALDYSPRFAYINEPLCLFRGHAGSESISKDLYSEYFLSKKVYLDSHQIERRKYEPILLLECLDRAINTNRVLTIYELLSEVSEEQLKRYLIQSEITSCALYGAGKYGVLLYRFLKKNCDLKCVIDKNPKEIDEKSTISPDDIWPDVDLIIITSIQHESEIRELISKKKIQANVMGMDRFLMDIKRQVL